MVAFVIVGLIVIAVFNTIAALTSLFKARGCLEAILLITLSGAVVAVEVWAAVLLTQLL